MPDFAKVEDGAVGFSSSAARCMFVEGLSPSMRAVEAVIGELAQSEVPVLLLAERGAGKHATARRIHEMSRRSGQRFWAVTCATWKPEELAQTDGDDGFQQGTVFLDEIANLSLESQARIMELLPQVENRGASAAETGRRGLPPMSFPASTFPGPSFPGAGYPRPSFSGPVFARPSFPRLICGSERDLEVEVKTGRLREDLYYRISGVCLRLPPLRIEHFLEKHARELRRPVPKLSAETQQLFQDYSWPGNVRELENAAEAVVVLGDEDVAMGGLRALLSRSDAGGNGTRVSLKQVARAASRVAEKELILRVLTRTRWNRRRAAQELQISYKALLYKMKQIGCSEYGSS